MFYFAQAILLISVLISCATAPLNMMIDFLFQDLILAPTEDEYNAELRSRESNQPLGSRTSTVAEDTDGVLDNSIPIASNNVPPLLPVRRNSLLKRTVSTEEPSDMTTMKVPPGVTEAHGSISMMLKDDFNKTVPATETRSSRITGNRLSSLYVTDRNDEASLYDAVERGELDDPDSVSMHSLCRKLHAQSEELTGSAKREFQEQWQLDPKLNTSNRESSMFISDNVVPSGMSAAVRRILFFWKEKKKTRKQILTEAIEATSQFSKQKIKKLKGASNIQVGLEIMHLFIIDLLGYVCCLFTFICLCEILAFL
jgi:hypothetical protein